MHSISRLLLSVASVALFGLFATPASATTQRFALDPTHTQVQVSWSHFGFSNPSAAFNVSEGTLIWDSEDPSRSSVTVTIPVASVHTQVPALDETFKADYFKAGKHPEITFTSSAVTPIANSSRYRIEGKLTVHGITRPVTLEATLNKAGEHPMLHAPAMGFDATATLNRSDFGIDAYTPFVSDEVRVRITVEAIDAAAFATMTQASDSAAATD